MKVCLHCGHIFEDVEVNLDGRHLVNIKHKAFATMCGPTVDTVLMASIATSLMDIIRQC